MHTNRLIILIFYVFPIIICVQLAYGLIIREPYPSFMMPGFSRIDNDGNAYKIVDRRVVAITDTKDSLVYNLDIINSSVSKIALSRMIDLAFFEPTNAKTENSAQKKYYGIIKDMIGPVNYKRYVLDIRYPPVDKEAISRFKKWIYKNIDDSLDIKFNQLFIRRTEETRDFKSGDILETEILDEIELVE